MKSSTRWTVSDNQLSQLHIPPQISNSLLLFLRYLFTVKLFTVMYMLIYFPWVNLGESFCSDNRRNKQNAEDTLPVKPTLK